MTPGPANAGSPTPAPEETEGAAAKVQDSNVTDEQWQAMQTMLNAIYEFRTENGEHDPSKHFQRKVNKRITPDYYDVIQEPMALSTIKVTDAAKINFKQYKNIADFVRDFALIPHNAQLYNRPEALVYQDALIIKGAIEAELKKMVDQGILTEEAASLPDLGDIPPATPRAPDEDEEDEDEDDEEDEDESEEESARRKRRRGGRSGATSAKREAKDDGAQKAADADARKKRGRPPRVDTPMEARIKSIMKGIRKLKSSDGQLMVSHFEKLPDKAAMPEYFQEIKTPLAIDILKRKLKRKKYQSVDHFMKDMEIMFENAKMYNEDESLIYKDAVELQLEARRLAEQEKKKPDSEFMQEDGRLPLEYILHNGELWKVGDWVHIQNPNDISKPIVAQIYRTWQDAEGQKWVNACWYYRPEQTVHRFERHFFENEVVKTGQYRDHHVDELVDKCYVMFFTRFNKGRPRGFPPDKEVYVCEARYNEENKKLNKIKTWASCLPDEVREKDYEMDLFEAPRKMKKVPSPIKHLLKENAKESDELPEPTWGVENAPPIVGAVHRRPREANESPPPEPTPSPPPQAPPQSARQVSNMPDQSPGRFRTDADGDVNMDEAGTPAAVNSTQGQGSQAPISYDHHPRRYSQHQSASPAPTSYQAGFNARGSPFTPQASHASLAQTQQSSHPAHVSSAHQSHSHQSGSRTNVPAGNPYNPPKPVEMYHLSDAANQAIPEDIRNQFHQDEHGHVLFSDKPPLDVLKPVKEGMALGHSPGYLAEKGRRMRARLEGQKRRRAEEQSLREEERSQDPQMAAAKDAVDDQTERVADEIKRRRLAAYTAGSFPGAAVGQSTPRMTDEQLSQAQADLQAARIQLFLVQMQKNIDDQFKLDYGERWEEAKALNGAWVAREQEKARLKKVEREENARRLREREHISLKDPDVFLDDVDPRLPNFFGGGGGGN
ncbi:MAG: hypothetical protein M1819_005785 [Sarea resinae]|nr:MAG: hypothetical protein M1819_005785 [Sarea resinae]